MVALSTEPIGTQEEEDAPAPSGAAAPALAYGEMSAWLYNEADRLYNQGQYVDSEQRVRQLLELQARVVGTRHPDFALGLTMLGELRFLQEDRAGAEDVFRQALRIRGETLGPRHPEFAVSLTCLAGLLWRRGDWEQAEALFRQALQIRREVLGERHADTIQSRKELARLLRRRGDWEGAQALIRPTLERAGMLGGPRRDLTRDVLVLSTTLGQLGETLASAARLMRERGTPPPGPPVEALAECRRRFDAIRDEAVRRIEALDVPGPSPQVFETLQELAGLLDDLVEAEVRQAEREQMRGRALAVLDRVLALSYLKGEEFPPLRECQDRARQLRETIASGHWMNLPAQTEKLAEGTHALVSFLVLVEQRESLSDRSWARLHEVVGETLGKPLASAASRARLAVRPAPGESTTGPSARSPSPSIDRLPSPVPAPAPIPSEGLSQVHVAVCAPDSHPGVVDPTAPAAPSHGGNGAPAPSPPLPRTDPRTALARDLAVASLVPTMGRVINLPGDSAHEAKPHRLFRVGQAPAVVIRPAAAEPTDHASDRRPPGHPPADLPRRYARYRRVGAGVITGPLGLFQAPTAAADPHLGDDLDRLSQRRPAAADADRPAPLARSFPVLPRLG